MVAFIKAKIKNQIAKENHLSLAERSKIVLKIVSLLFKAVDIRITKSREIVLAPVAIDQTLSPEKINKIVSFINHVVWILMLWKPGRCFYRSYVIANILRKKGVPLQINFGCENYLERTGKAKAHSWLTLQGLPFAEKGNPSVRFPIRISVPDSDVNFWLGTKGMSREKIPHNCS